MRLKVYRIGLRRLHALLNGWRSTRVAILADQTGLFPRGPPSHDGLSVEVLVEHESFDDIKDGAVAPECRFNIKYREIPVIDNCAADLDGLSLEDLRGLRDRINARIYDLERQ